MYRYIENGGGGGVDLTGTLLLKQPTITVVVLCHEKC